MKGFGGFCIAFVLLAIAFQGPKGCVGPSNENLVGATIGYLNRH